MVDNTLHSLYPYKPIIVRTSGHLFFSAWESWPTFPSIPHSFLPTHSPPTFNLSFYPTFFFPHPHCGPQPSYVSFFLITNIQPFLDFFITHPQPSALPCVTHHPPPHPSPTSGHPPHSPSSTTHLKASKENLEWTGVVSLSLLIVGSTSHPLTISVFTGLPAGSAPSVAQHFNGKRVNSSWVGMDAWRGGGGWEFCNGASTISVQSLFFFGGKSLITLLAEEERMVVKSARKNPFRTCLSRKRIPHSLAKKKTVNRMSPIYLFSIQCIFNMTPWKRWTEYIMTTWWTSWQHDAMKKMNRVHHDEETRRWKECFSCFFSKIHCFVLQRFMGNWGWESTSHQHEFSHRRGKWKRNENRKQKNNKKTTKIPTTFLTWMCTLSLSLKMAGLGMRFS